MNAELKPYAKYKESGVPWLGSLPAHWGTRAAKRLFAESGERARPGDIQLSATQSHGVIAQAEYERIIGRKVVRIVNHLDKRKHVEKDDFVISMRSFQGGLERAWTAGAIRSSYVVLKPTHGVHIPYFAHLFKSTPYIHALRSTCQFIRDGQDLTFADFCQASLPIVPPDEQKTIADFLDANESRVRRFIRAKRRLVEVLSEQKQAIITHAVTGGLNPHAPRKPSGIDWLGDVPEHWEVRRLRNIADLLVSNVDKHSHAEELPVRLCNYVDVYKNRKITDQLVFMQATASHDEVQRFRIRRGDVIITKDSEEWTDIAVPSLVEYEADDLVCGYHLAILRPGATVRGAYLTNALLSRPVAVQFHIEAKGVTRYGLSHSGIKDVVLPLPPVSEQDTIVASINVQTKEIEQTIAATKREIDLIREYRTRLVADVVTGKVDVRAAAAAIADESPVGGADTPIDDTDQTQGDSEMDEDDGTASMTAATGEEAES